MTVFPAPPEGFEFAEVEDDSGVLTEDKLRYVDEATGEILTLAELRARLDGEPVEEGRQWRDRTGRWIDMPDPPASPGTAELTRDEERAERIEGVKKRVVAEVFARTRERLAAHNISFRGPSAAGKFPMTRYEDIADVIDDALTEYPRLKEPGRPLRHLVPLSSSDFGDSTAQAVRPQLDADAAAGKRMGLGIAAAPQWDKVALLVGDTFPLQIPGPDATAQLSPASASGWKGVMWHEVGHLIAHQLGLLDPHTPDAENQRRHVEHLGRYGLTFEDLSPLSMYAAASPSEAFAELAAMYHTPGFAEQLPPDVLAKATTMFSDFK